MRASRLVWTANPDGKHGEVVAEYRGHKLTVYSDRHGDSWGYYIDDGEDKGDYETENEAKQAAVNDVDDM